MVNVSVAPKPGYYRTTGGNLVAHVKRGCVLIACNGDAHKQANSQLESCRLCADGPWGWRIVRASRWFSRCGRG